MRLLAVLLAVACFAPAYARAQENLVVLELYTSQGCSSCPPADALFADLAERDDVIALALHVDYWDYLGWKDEFARPRHTARQKAYAKAARSRTIYTPEMIVQGEERLKGHDAASIAAEIADHRRGSPGAALSIRRDGEAIRISVAPVGAAAGPIGRSNGNALGAPGQESAPHPAPGPVDVHVVRYIPEEDVSIGGGENAGQTLTYRNIVTDWQTIGQWDGTSTEDFVFEGVGDGPVAVILQRARMGRIVAAAQLP